MNLDEEEIKWLSSLPELVREVLICKKNTGKVRFSKEDYERYALDFRSMHEVDRIKVREMLDKYNKQYAQ